MRTVLGQSSARKPRNVLSGLLTVSQAHCELQKHLLMNGAETEGSPADLQMRRSLVSSIKVRHT